MKGIVSNKKEVVFCDYSNYGEENSKKILVCISAQELLGEEFKDLNLYIHKNCNILGEILKEKESKWVVTNRDSGKCLTQGRTKNEAIQELKKIIKHYGKEKIQELIIDNQLST